MARRWVLHIRNRLIWLKNSFWHQFILVSSVSPLGLYHAPIRDHVFKSMKILHYSPEWYFRTSTLFRLLHSGWFDYYTQSMVSQSDWTLGMLLILHMNEGGWAGMRIITRRQKSSGLNGSWGIIRHSTQRNISLDSGEGEFNMLIPAFLLVQVTIFAAP